MAERDIIINQTLHGYRSGHSLLASSIELTTPEKKELLLLSDFSGSGNESGFSEYFTGYPLTNSKYYAFAKTWYANEMPRPGCVWTHTLLLDISILWTIKNINLLQTLFIRPNSPDVGKYNEPLQFPSSYFHRSNEKTNENFYWITDELYTRQEKLIVLSDSSEKYSQSIFQLWSYQWPRLKRNFKFCTGSMSPRHLGTDLFDLQIMPYSREKFIQRVEKAKYYIIQDIDTLYSSDWIKDYRLENPELIEDFMTQYGSDVEGSTNKFLSMFKAFNLIGRQIEFNYEEAIKYINENFQTNEGRVLKASLIAKLLGFQKASAHKPIQGILTDDQLKDINWKYSEIILSAWKNKQLSLTELNRILSIFTKRFGAIEVLSILEKIPAKYWIENYSIYQSEIDKLLPKIDIADIAIVWKSEDFLQDIWWEAISKNKEIDIKAIVEQMLMINNGRFAEPLLENYGVIVFNVLFNIILREDLEIENHWQYLIKLEPVQAFQALSSQKKFSEQLITLIPNTLAPTANYWRNVESKSFDQYFRKINEFQFTISATANYTFFLSSAFTQSVEEPEELTALIFEKLHNNLKDDICDHFTWQRFKMIMGNDLYELVEHDFFSKLFKERHEIPEWDRCEFLRRSLVSCFVKFGWNPLYLLKIITNESIFKSIVKFGVESKPFKKILKSLKKEINHSNDYAYFYTAILKKYLD